jgi:ubiquinone/menaquinone biosynthesis C-methylase UbiE
MATAAAANQGPATAYALGRDPAESARLRRQSDELRPYAADLLGRIGLRPGQTAIDLGCGPSGILDLLAAAVAPGGHVIGLDADPAHVAMARRHVAELGLSNTEIVQGDARDTGLAAGSFDLVHSRTLLATIPSPGEVVTEMARLARPGGWVASQEPDAAESLCYPEIPAWDRLNELFRASFGRDGADLRIGRRLTEIYRAAGLDDIQVTAHSPLFPAGHSRRTIRADLVRSLRPVIVQMGLADEGELDRLDRQVREHLADPRVIVMSHFLFVAWARKPAVIR